MYGSGLTFKIGKIAQRKGGTRRAREAGAGTRMAGQGEQCYGGRMVEVQLSGC
jgi:hypothetical protein